MLSCLNRLVRGDTATTELATEFAANYSIAAAPVYYDSVLASWNYNTNITEYNSEMMVTFLLSYLYIMRGRTFYGTSGLLGLSRGLAKQSFSAL